MARTAKRNIKAVFLFIQVVNSTKKVRHAMKVTVKVRNQCG